MTAVLVERRDLCTALLFVVYLLGAIWCGSAGAAVDGDLIRRARKAADAGRFTEAEQMLRGKTSNADAPVVAPYSVELEILRRIRLEYSVTLDSLLTRLRKTIPDVTVKDIKRWTNEGVLQNRRIDGKVWYFEGEPKNLFRFSEAARLRQKDLTNSNRAGWKFSLPDHVARLVHLAETSKRPCIFPVQHRVTFQLAVNSGQKWLKRGARVRCWLPFPQEYRQQTSVRLIKAVPANPVIARNGLPHRTIYFEQVVQDPEKPPVFRVEFEFITRAYCPDLDPSEVKPYQRKSALYQEFTAERSPHIVFSPAIRQVVTQVIGDEQNPLLRARSLFRWVAQNVRYCSEVEYSTIRNISDKAFTTRRGDCGVQSLLFITLCRAAGIPARWQSGWETKPNGRNMHDWAEFYIEPFGWLPADPSYGLQKHSDPRVQEFYCGHMDPYRLIVNLDYAHELTPAKTSFRSEPNDFQRGEIEIDGHNLYFNDWTWKCDVQTVPLENDFWALEEALDAQIPNLLTRGSVPGAVVLVGKKMADGYETWQKAYGCKQIKPTSKPMPMDAIFDLASMSKPIATGTALMILADQGKVSVDDPVGKYLPEFNEGEKKNVTIRHLMTHTSGERPYVGQADRKKIEAKSGFPCRQAIRDYIRQLPLIRKPGKVMQYSCLNAILCAEIVRTVSGMEHSEFVARHVFRPLGMTDTMFNPPTRLDARLVPTTKAEYGRGEGGYLLGQVHDPLAAMQGGISGNAGLFSTAADLSRFAQMILNKGSLEAVHILKPQTIQRMTSIQNPGAKNTKGVPDRRGLLWDIYPPDRNDKGVDTLYAFGHTGYTGTAIRFYPSKGVYIILLTNRVHPNDTGRVSQLRKEVWHTVGQVIMLAK